MSSEREQSEIQDSLFVGTHGHVAAVCKKTGKTIWEKSLPSTGYAVVSIVFEQGRLYCATAGRLFALDPKTGEILWENSLRGLGMGLVFLTTAQSNNTEALLTLLSQSTQSAQTSSTGS